MATDIFPGAQLIQLQEWGYPMGSLRPIPPPLLAFSVIHITAGTGTAQAEANWRKNDPALQNSATFFVNQDGTVVQCLADPYRMDPWTNGVLNQPDLTNPRIAAVVRDGVNANERSLVTIELCGREPTLRITPAQEATAGRIIRHYHNRMGLPISRQTVVGHYQFDRVNRPNCPSVDKSVIDRIVALAQGTGPAAGVKMALKPVRQDWTTGVGETNGAFYLDGPGVGEKKWFTTAEVVTTVGETPDGLWRLVFYPSGEYLWMARANLTPIAGTRVPSTGYATSLPGVDQSKEIAALTVKVTSLEGRLGKTKAVSQAHATKQVAEESAFDAAIKAI